MVSVACLALLSITSLSNSQTLDVSQVYNTQNLVNSGVDPTSTTGTWQNIGLWNQGLPCWAPGGAVYCGPQPYYNSGSFNFSYGVTDVYQIANVAAALPNSGTGLRVNGYNFGFTAKNGNGWDGGGLDTLSAYVNVYGADGKSVRYDYYNLNYQFDWTTFNYSKIFDIPYASKDLSTVRYGFVGGDTSNYWAGPYGPEIINVNFSLKYSVDPCSVDVLSSPSCPGYLDKIASMSAPAAAPTTTTTAPAPAAVTITAPAADVAQPVATTPAATTTAAAPTVTTSTATASATPTATNPQPRVGEVTVSGSPAKTTVSTSQILSIVRAEQSRISALETATVQQAVTQAQQQSEAAQAQSMTVSAATMTASAATAQMQGSEQRASIYSISTGPVVASQFGVTAMAAANAQSQPREAGRNDSTVKTETVKFSATDPIANIVNNNTVPRETPQETKSAAVNSRAQDNEAAGGVSIAAIARTPAGFDAYTTAMPDSAFYAPREIYRNQRVTDNARAQRLLQGASDRLHQEMIDSQYRK